MKRAATLIVIAALGLTAGCGGDSSDISAAPSASATQAAPPETTTATTESTSPTPSETAAADPAPAILAKDDLEAALLTVKDVPVGYAQDPPSKASNKTFCDYKPPFTETTYVSRDFTKGGGMSAQLLRVGIRQYGSADQARASFDALNKALTTCTTETYQGTKLEYAAMSAPQVGDESVGVRITADSTVLLENFALVGPVVVVTGGGGLIESDADEIANLLGTQVDAYQAAAGK